MTEDDYISQEEVQIEDWQLESDKIKYGIINY